MNKYTTFPTVTKLTIDAAEKRRLEDEETVRMNRDMEVREIKRENVEEKVRLKDKKRKAEQKKLESAEPATTEAMVAPEPDIIERMRRVSLDSYLSEYSVISSVLSVRSLDSNGAIVGGVLVDHAANLQGFETVKPQFTAGDAPSGTRSPPALVPTQETQGPEQGNPFVQHCPAANRRRIALAPASDFGLTPLLLYDIVQSNDGPGVNFNSTDVLENSPASEPGTSELPEAASTSSNSLIDSLHAKIDHQSLPAHVSILATDHGAPAQALPPPLPTLCVEQVTLVKAADIDSNRFCAPASVCRPAAAVSSFWLQFSKFTPIPTASFRSEFSRLAKAYSWNAKTQKKRHIEALTAEFDLHYGTCLTRLDRWQLLCKDVGINNAPTSITKCKKALRHILINLYNLVDSKRNPNIEIRRFKSHSDFVRYTRKGRTFPRECAKQDGFVKILLKSI